MLAAGPGARRLSGGQPGSPASCRTSAGAAIARKNVWDPGEVEYILDAASEVAKFRASPKETTACKGAVRFGFSPLRFNLFHLEEGNFLC